MKPKEGQEISKSAAKNKKKREAKARAKQEQEVATQEVVCPTSTSHNCYKPWPDEPWKSPKSWSVINSNPNWGCLSVCLSASLSVHLPVFLSIFLSFLWSICPYACQFFSLGSKAYNHHWGHNIYNCSTTSSLDINVSGSEVKTSSIITSITTSSWYNSSTRERKEAKKFEKGKISLYPTANIRKHKITKMCSVLSINQKEYLQQKKFEQTHHQKWESINQSLEISI